MDARSWRNRRLDSCVFRLKIVSFVSEHICRLNGTTPTSDSMDTPEIGEEEPFKLPDSLLGKQSRGHTWTNTFKYRPFGEGVGL